MLRIRIAVSRRVLQNLPRGHRAIHAGQREIHHDHVRAAVRAACSTASWPSLASPTTSISGLVLQHAAEAAAHQVVIVHQQDRDLGLRHAPPRCQRHRQPHQGAAAVRSHRIRACRAPARRAPASIPVPCRGFCLRCPKPTPSSSTSSTTDPRRIPQPHRRLRRSSNGAPHCSTPPAARDTHGWPRSRSTAGSLPVFLVSICDAGLLLEHRQILSQRRFQARLRPAPPGAAPAKARAPSPASTARSPAPPADPCAATHPARRAPSGALQHGADRRQNLAELVVQLARDGAERVLLHRDQLLRQLAAPLRKRRHLLEHPPVVLDQVQPGGRNHHQHGRQKQVDVALRRARKSRCVCAAACLFALVVLHQQARHRGAERRLPRLQREADPRARLSASSVCGQREDAVERIPELRHASRPGTGAGRAGSRAARLLLARHGVFQVGADALELALPGGQRIRFAPRPACRAWPGRRSSGRSGCAAAAANRCGCGRWSAPAAAAGRAIGRWCSPSRRPPPTA